MSQVLALIVAASVLMMTALTVIFMVTGTAGDTGRQADVGACQGTVTTICSTSDNANTQLPSVCQGPDGTASQEVASGVRGINGQGATTVDCSQY